MTPIKKAYGSFSVLLLFLLVFFYLNNLYNQERVTIQSFPKIVKVEKDIMIKNYFEYIDSIVHKYYKRDSLELSEHVLVRHNPWIIDTLANTDYYKMIERDSFVYNQKELIVLKKGSEIVIPDSAQVNSIIKSFTKTLLDINIPEYKFRILEDSVQLYEFVVRVGRNEKKYLKFGDRITDLRTKTGTGTIVAHVCNPDYYNPVDGFQYFVTRRDDERMTSLPQIPFIETEINGIRNGQLIHPTTNPATLNSAYSNGCIGTSEADAWIIYYYAPIGTKINIRYDLKIKDSLSNNIFLKDIYGYSN